MENMEGTRRSMLIPKADGEAQSNPKAHWTNIPAAIQDDLKTDRSPAFAPFANVIKPLAGLVVPSAIDLPNLGK